VCCSVLQCVAVCCSVLQCVAVCCSVLQCVAVCCGVLQVKDMGTVTVRSASRCTLCTATYTATHCNTLQHTATYTATHCNTLQHTATYTSTHVCVLCGSDSQVYCTVHIIFECEVVLNTFAGCAATHTATHCNTHCNTQV